MNSSASTYQHTPPEPTPSLREAAIDHLATAVEGGSVLKELSYQQARSLAYQMRQTPPEKWPQNLREALRPLDREGPPSMRLGL